ncbi:inositol polyphosphate phosphatase [Roridomyces roridus]|uniref:phosphoinositide 5-phosphatase n=1 Tax=Roridomyces roridus TaxID=1738132 RepID=A0AAD7C4S4_9AGAR|nr:inositol polyphosphate phosphatase [Roridomyces roridus]
MYLYLANDVPTGRILYLVSNNRILAFRQSSNPAQAVVEFLPQSQVDLSNVIRLNTRVVKGCLGLISIEKDLFLAVVTSATEVGNTRPTAEESVARIHEVCFYSLTSATWDELPVESLTNPEAIDTMMNRDSYGQPSTPPIIEHPCMPLTKILSSGHFYYAKNSNWDLSSRLAVRLPRDSHSTWDLGTFDEKFIWNAFLIRSLLDLRERLDPLERDDFDTCQFIVLAIQGYVGTATMALPAPPKEGKPTIATLSLISRLGWKRAGTRFNARGVDDDGNTANFVETETIFTADQHCVSYAQIRGSVPVFWEQQGLQTFGQRIQITRPTSSQPAFNQHFAQLLEEYDSVHAINLLGTKENEAILTTAYARHLSSAREVIGDQVFITHFDFHNAVRIGGHDSVIRELKRLDAISRHVAQFGYTMCEVKTDEIVTQQSGIFRTNCLDCLDRTNFVQDIISRTTLEEYILQARQEWIHSNSLWTHHRELWAENGDALSKIYAGTGALNTSFTRSGKRTLAGVLSDATKSVSRAYINNFQDKGKQIAIDMFLGNMSNQRPVTIFDPIHDSVRIALENRVHEYSSTKQCTIFVGTWNLNGRPPSESLLPWLFPRDGIEPDMFVLGFQEIVPLTAQQIVQTDPDKRRMWERRILETLDHRPNKKATYVLLRSEQLVGTALLVLVRTELLPVMRNVEAASRKTGLRGMSGNKGAVGVRLDYYDTSFCFLTAHLAAGHSNVDERNMDYRTIANGLHFLKGKTIPSHENVIWLADTNYRIDLDNETVRSSAESDDFDMLLAGDQLRQAIDSGTAFAGYEEGPLLFRPTYRYDLGTDRYDTSEKMRIPAWTDRILYRSRGGLDLGVYSRAELKGSDHKPVFAIFHAAVRVVDVAKRTALSQLLLQSVIATAPGEKLDEKLAALALPPSIGDLPPPSSDDAAWWNGPEFPNGAISMAELRDVRAGSTNPFDSPDESSLSSSSTSDEELYTDALMLQTPMTPVPAVVTRKPPPPPPPRPAKKPTD